MALIFEIHYTIGLPAGRRPRRHRVTYLLNPKKNIERSSTLRIHIDTLQKIDLLQKGLDN